MMINIIKLNLLNENKLIKNLNKNQSKFLLSLRNNKIVRNYSQNKKKIKLNDHKNWIEQFYKSKRNKLIIIYRNKLMIGYIRMELNYSKFKVSWALKKNFHNKGIMSKELFNATKNKLKKYKCLILSLASIKKKAKFILKKNDGTYYLFTKN